MSSERANDSGLEFEGKCVALGVSGGIAAYKAVEVLRGLQRAGCTVRVGMTRRACEFVTPLTFRALSGAHVVVDDYAPDNPDPIAHITFSQTVELFVVAPATANIIAKFAGGIADDFLTSTYLASNAPVLVAPAMNTTMLMHPATRRNLARLRADGVRIVEPEAGEMACGTIGPGRLPDPQLIVSAALEILRERERRASDLAGERVLIAAGAVADYRPAARAESKIKKSKFTLTLALEPTPDILAEVSRSRRNGLLVFGFAAETDEVVSNARAKLHAKDLDAVVANDLTQAGAGFDAETNIITLLTRDREQPTTLPLMSKLDAAGRILDEVVRLRRKG